MRLVEPDRVELAGGGPDVDADDVLARLQAGDGHLGHRLPGGLGTEGDQRVGGRQAVDESAAGRRGGGRGGQRGGTGAQQGQGHERGQRTGGRAETWLHQRSFGRGQDEAEASPEDVRAARRKGSSGPRSGGHLRRALAFERAAPPRHPDEVRPRSRPGDPRPADRLRLRPHRLPLRARREPAHLPAHRPRPPHGRAARPARQAGPEHHRRRPPAGRHRHRQQRRGQAARAGAARGQEPVRDRPLLRGRLPPGPRAAQRAARRRLPAGLGVDRQHGRADRPADREGPRVRR